MSMQTYRRCFRYVDDTCDRTKCTITNKMRDEEKVREKVGFKSMIVSSTL